MRREPVASDFQVDVFDEQIVVFFVPTKSLYVFERFTNESEIAEFGLLSPLPMVRHGVVTSGTRRFEAAEVEAMAFRAASMASERAGAGGKMGGKARNKGRPR
jgi:hypothetical protein